MTEKPETPPKTDPETFVLRGPPPKVVRFKRNLLIGVAGVGVLTIFGVGWFALRGTHLLRPPTDDNLYSIDHKRLPDAVAALPPSYDHIKLGAPLPGDLGKPVVDRERSLGINPADLNFKPNSEDDANRAERIRLAAQARLANEAGVFFQAANNTASAPPAVTPVASVPPAEAPPTSVALNIDPTKDPNNQGRKLDLVNGKPDKDIYNPHTLQKPVSPYELLAGTVISASLVTGLNSDLPGTVIAQISQDLRDSVSGQYLLIPAGSRVIGKYDSVVAFGQSRALIVWQRIIMPNGTSILIDNQPATDARGYTGLEDDVDYHTWQLLKGVGLSTLMGVGTQVTFGSGNSDLVEAIRESTQESANQAGQQIIQKDLQLQPTITIRQGFPLRIVLSCDLVLAPYGS